MKWYLWLTLFFAGFVSKTNAQNVVLDISYQPQTNYQWSESRAHSMTIEYLGAEDMEEMLKAMGYDIYSESTDYFSIKVNMETKARKGQNIPFRSLIKDLNRDYVTSAAESFRANEEALEYDDVEIIGIINRFQKMEIDSITGVDSLSEKNKVFTLLDNIHRSLKFPKDTLELGRSVVKSSQFNQGGNLSIAAILETTYSLEKVVDNLAYIRLEHVISSMDEGEIDGLSDTNNISGSGQGIIVYNLADNLVQLHNYSLTVKSIREMMGISVETATESNYNWTMEIKE